MVHSFSQGKLCLESSGPPFALNVCTVEGWIALLVVPTYNPLLLGASFSLHHFPSSVALSLFVVKWRHSSNLHLITQLWHDGWYKHEDGLPYQYIERLWWYKASQLLWILHVLPQNTYRDRRLQKSTIIDLKYMQKNSRKKLYLQNSQITRCESK